MSQYKFRVCESASRITSSVTLKIKRVIPVQRLQRDLRVWTTSRQSTRR
jgi:hypothetical protein